MSKEKTETARMSGEITALEKALVHSHAATLAAQYLGDATYGPLFVSALGVKVEDGKVTVQVRDSTGRARVEWDQKTKRLAAVDGETLAAELRQNFPTLPWASTVATDDKKTAKSSATETLADMTTAAFAKRAKENAAETAAVIAKARQANPWAKATENLTDQMRLTRLAPDIARELSATANAVRKS